MIKRLISRSFSTVNPYYAEHYQYPGNPTYEEFKAHIEREKKTYVQDTTMFKPKEQIEFNRVGELLLYEAQVYRIKPVYFPFPHCLPLLSTPFLLAMYLENPFEWTWHYTNFFTWPLMFSFYPMVEYFYNLRYYIHKLSLLRGGKVLKVEHSNITGMRWKTWIFIDEVHLLSKDKLTLLPEKGIDAKVVDASGSLAEETHIQVENFVDVGRNIEDVILSFCKEGKVYEPEILSAVLRGFEVDTSNFRINTLHTERWLEPTLNI